MAEKHIASRRARKHYTGLVIITQDPVADLKLMGDKFITQQLIMPFESDELAREVASMRREHVEPDLDPTAVGGEQAVYCRIDVLEQRVMFSS